MAGSHVGDRQVGLAVLQSGLVNEPTAFVAGSLEPTRRPVQTLRFAPCCTVRATTRLASEANCVINQLSLEWIL